MSDSVIWILTADDWNAQIHVSQHGASSLLHAIRNRIPERMVRRVSDDEGADFAQFRAAAGLPPSRPRDTHLCFAHELLWLLAEGEGRYDGLVIMATTTMMDALNAIAGAKIRERIIAQIVLAAPTGNAVIEACTERLHEGREMQRAVTASEH